MRIVGTVMINGRPFQEMQLEWQLRTPGDVVIRLTPSQADAWIGEFRARRRCYR